VIVPHTVWEGRQQEPSGPTATGAILICLAEKKKKKKTTAHVSYQGPSEVSDGRTLHSSVGEYGEGSLVSYQGPSEVSDGGTLHGSLAKLRP
jgi:hypothetical protein